MEQEKSEEAEARELLWEQANLQLPTKIEEPWGRPPHNPDLFSTSSKFSTVTMLLAYGRLSAWLREGRFSFLDSHQVYDLAYEKGFGHEGSLPNQPCIYAFISMDDKWVVKIGETDNARQRIHSQHLPKQLPSNPAKSNLPAQFVGCRWPDCLLENIVLYVFPASELDDKHERKGIEIGLINLLEPFAEKDGLAR